MASLPRTTPKSHPPQLKADARRAEGQGDTARAIALLEEVLHQTPDDWSAVQRLADLRAREGSTRRAVGLYRRLAEHYEEDDHLPRAIAAWRIVLRHDPGWFGAHVKLGELYGRQGFRVESRRHYEVAVAGFEGQRRLHEASLARRALQVAREETSASVGPAEQADADDAGPLSPDQEELVAERLVEAKMYRRYNLPEQTRVALETVLGMAPGHPEARAELAELRRDEEDRARAKSPGNPQEPETATLDVPRAPVAGEPAEDQDLESLGFTLVLEDSPDGDDGARRPVQPTETEEARDEPGELVIPGLFDDLVAEGGRSALPVPQAARPFVAPVSDVLPVSRQQMEAQTALDDDRARYDLGIAYRQMGLIDEAIAELQLASRVPGRLVDCASLLAACFLEKRLPELAVRWLERGLSSGTPGELARHALRYQLADALEAAGETERALEIFTELYGEAARHRDVAARVERLRGGPGQTGTASNVTRGE